MLRQAAGEMVTERTFESRTLSVRIDRDAAEVYDFASVPENF